MDGRTFARFHLDVGAGDAILEPADTVHGRDWLDFAGRPPGVFPTISREQQFAEKIHAYTLPREGRNNSRVRDLIDLFLLVRLGLDPDATRRALHATFETRTFQPLENTLPKPSNDWNIPFRALADECGIQEDCTTAFKTIAAFYAELEVGD